MASERGMAGERRERVNALCGLLEKQGVSGAVLDRRDDQFYFTGYTGSDSVLVLAVKKRRAWLVTDSRYTEEAGKTALGAETVLWKKGFAGFVGGMLRKNRFRKIAFTPQSLTTAFFQTMRDEAGKDCAWHAAEPEIGGLRAVKSPAEVKAVRKALACAEGAFLASKKRWKAGMTEIEVKNDLEWEMRRRGAQDAAFESIIACGPNASLPHGHAGERKIQAGKMLLLDFGARVDRYNSDLTRTLWHDSIPAVWRKRYQTVLGAQQAGIDALRAGVTGETVDAAARAVLARSGLEEYFTHNLGHSIGLTLHEDPRLSRINGRPLQSGNIVTIEPGVYFPGAGGIRIEDDALVGLEGAQVLGSLPRDLDSVVF